MTRLVWIALFYVIIFGCTGMLLIPGFSEKVTVFGYPVIPIAVALASLLVVFLAFNLLKCQTLPKNTDKK